jgi:hypothetical protein
MKVDRKRWFKESLRTFGYAASGMAFAIVMSFVGSNPTKWTYFWWGLTVLFLIGVSIFAGYWGARRRMEIEEAVGNRIRGG